MAAPTFVPADPVDTVRWYRSAPRRPDPWVVGRPGEVDSPQPAGEGLGTPGPDAGYALTLAAAFRGTLTLRPGEHESDAIVGGAAVAMKRAGLLGRAPVAHDLRVGLGVWGFLDDNPANVEAARATGFTAFRHVDGATSRRHLNEMGIL